MITTEQIKDLRDQTGVSVMQCKRALEEAEGNVEKALMILRSKSSDIAQKKGDRDAADGLVVTKKDGDKTVVLVLNCETDFVAKNDDFVTLANTLAEILLTEGKDAVEAKAPDMINPVIQKIGENIKLGEMLEIKGGTTGAYIHSGKLGVVVELVGGDETLAKDIAMHIAAMKPAYLSANEIPETARTMARELFEKEVAESDKPQDIKEKMLEGKLSTYFKELTLLEQVFIKGDMTVQNLLTSKNASIANYTIVRI